MRIVKTQVDETKKRENALRIIRSMIKKKGRESLFDLTGLSGGYPIKEEDIKILETYVGPAIFEEKLQELGKKHLGGEKVLAFNRTTSGILATILTFAKVGTYVVHYLPRPPSHPSIPKSVKLAGAKYLEYYDVKDFPDNTSLIIITGATMDLDVMPTENFEKIVKMSGDIPVFVDDASGARVRTVLYGQPTAIELGADLVITSTDKLMNGPRGGLMSGKKELINKIKSTAHQLGLEAQPPLMAGMVRALEEFNPNLLKKSIKRKRKLRKLLEKDFEGVEETPTGIKIEPEYLKQKIKTDLSSKDLAFLFSMILLRSGIITIPAVGMPGASTTIRLDLSSKDAERIKLEELKTIFLDAFSKLKDIVKSPERCKEIIYGAKNDQN